MKTLKITVGALILVSVFYAFPSFSAEPPKNKIPYNRAKSVATKVVAGEIKSHKLEFEHGLWVYSFDILNDKGVIHEIQVDAVSGKIVSNKIETAADEAAEKKAEK